MDRAELDAIIPPVPSRAAADHGLAAAPDWSAVARELQGLNLITGARQRAQLSRDFHWYSPPLEEGLAGCIADLVVKPSTEDEVIRIAAVAARHRVPLTVRGGGTGNYGQCVPLVGGLVLDTTEMMRVLEVTPERIRVQAGVKLFDAELAARELGASLRIWPSTWKVATVAGFIAGGFGGVGSTAHGVLRDGGNLLECRVVTVEPEPKVIVLEGDAIQQVHHAYGTNGIVTEVTMALRPHVPWRHVIALFDDYRGVLDTGLAATQPASRPANRPPSWPATRPEGGIESFLLSAVEARFAPFYRVLGERFPDGAHALFSMIAPASMPAFEALVKAHGGRISMDLDDAGIEREGALPAYECAYNHTTLQALKADRGWTYLQIAYPQPFDPAIVMRHLARFGDEVLQHQEFATMHGQPATFALVLVRWRGRERMAELIRTIEADGCVIFNPHVVTIEDGGMKTIDDAQIAFKRRADPMGLMNPGKTRGWSPSMARGLDPRQPIDGSFRAPT